MSFNIQLKPKQNEAYSLMTQGKSIFLTGAAGSGKSEIIKLFVKIYNPLKKIAVTSTTGASALLINGVTLHSYLGIGLGKGSISAMSAKILNKQYLKNRWTRLDVLIIDEISMLSPELFDKLEEMGRIIRKNSIPFGGIQLVLSGDFLQLPCIDSKDFCFNAKSWSNCIDNVIYLDEIIRQTDPIFQNCLNHIRLGKLPDDVVQILESRVGVDIVNEFGIKPTKLFPLNWNVDQVNEEALDNLTTEDTQFFEYNMDIKVYEYVKDKQLVIEKFKKYCTASEVLQLCIGAQVILLYNLDLEAKLANGSRGVVIGFVNELPLVKFLNGVERIIDYHIWEVEEMDVKILQMIQIPLKLAYAISIHMCQGCSLDCVEVDLTNVFEYGQAYTALSRVRNLQGLSIIGYDVNKIKAHPKALEFYLNI